MASAASGASQPLTKARPPANTIKIVATYASSVRKDAQGGLTRSVLTLEEVAIGLADLEKSLRLDVDLASCSTRCQKFNSNFSWFISYDPKKFDASRLFGKSFKVKDKSGQSKHCVIFNPNEEVSEEKVTAFRVSMVPNSSCLTYIRAFFTKIAPSAKIVEFQEELNNKVRGYEHTSTGNVILKLKYKRSDESKVRIPTGIVSIAGLEVVIQRAGVPLGCFVCNKHDHSVRGCPLKEIKCSKCGKLGHEGKCYLARNIDNLVDLPDVESLEFEAPAPKPAAVRPSNGESSKAKKQIAPKQVPTTSKPAKPRTSSAGSHPNTVAMPRSDVRSVLLAQVNAPADSDNHHQVRTSSVKRRLKQKESARESARKNSRSSEPGARKGEDDINDIDINYSDSNSDDGDDVFSEADVDNSLNKNIDANDNTVIDKE